MLITGLHTVADICERGPGRACLPPAWLAACGTMGFCSALSIGACLHVCCRAGLSAPQSEGCASSWPPATACRHMFLRPAARADCITCNSVLGWKYEVAYEESQKYKEGKFILEKVGPGRGWVDGCVVVVGGGGGGGRRG